MRFRRTKPPAEGTRRVRERFAILPMTLDNEEVAWLERVTVTEVYATIRWIEAADQPFGAPPDPYHLIGDCPKWRRLHVRARA